MQLTMECHDKTLRIQSHDNDKGCTKVQEGNGLYCSDLHPFERVNSMWDWIGICREEGCVFLGDYAFAINFPIRRPLICALYLQ